jgi:hypothetical protein
MNTSSIVKQLSSPQPSYEAFSSRPGLMADTGPAIHSLGDAHAEALTDFFYRRFSFGWIIPLVNVAVFPACPADNSFSLNINNLAFPIAIRLMLSAISDLALTILAHSHFLLLWFKKSSMLSMTLWITT